MSEEIQPGGRESVSDYIVSETRNQKRHDDLDFDEKEKYYKRREKWFPRFAWFIVMVVAINYIIVIFSKQLDVSPWVLQSLITESMIGILGLAGVMAMYFYPLGKGISRKYKPD